MKHMSSKHMISLLKQFDSNFNLTPTTVEVTSPVNVAAENQQNEEEEEEEAPRSGLQLPPELTAALTNFE